jgi:sarcosine oxidase subunit gamma
VLVRAAPDSSCARTLAVGYGHAARGAGPFDSADDVLSVGWAPDGWLLLSETTSGNALAARVEAIAEGEFVSVVDVSHGHWLGRLIGPGAVAALASICAMDLSESATPNGSAFRSVAAGIPVTVIRDERGSERSYLVLCDRSYGRYLTDVLT